jgi:hypothetical protein
MTRVLHAHRIGKRRFYKVSELTTLGGKPHLVLQFIQHGAVRVPLFTVEIDPSRLRTAAGADRIAFYDDETTDPRF